MSRRQVQLLTRAGCTICERVHAQLKQLAEELDFDLSTKDVEQEAANGDTTLRATGTYRDELIYERGGWYFTSRELEWDSVSNGHSLTV